MKLWPLIFLLILVLGVSDAQAKRLGGGRSAGKQSANVTQSEAPALPQPAPVATPTQMAPAAAAPMSRPGVGLLGGLAAGLGLAWLAGHLEMTEGWIWISGLVLLAALAWYFRRHSGRSRRDAQMRTGYAFQGVGDIETARPAYRPENVGNDASARPWEQVQTFEPEPRNAGSVAPARRGWVIPPGFDVQGFVTTAKNNFIVLQQAWDRADLDTLRSMMTDGMLTEISSQLQERERLAAGAPNVTEVQMLHAQLLGIEELDQEYMASVEFSGMIREDRFAGPNPFREVWNMTKPRDGSRGWLVAGVQALQ